LGFRKDNEEDRVDMNWKASQETSNYDKKRRGKQSLWAGFAAFPNLLEREERYDTPPIMYM
jgi:hypothetical protein